MAMTVLDSENPSSHGRRWHHQCDLDSEVGSSWEVLPPGRRVTRRRAGPAAASRPVEVTDVCGYARIYMNCNGYKMQMCVYT